MPDIFFISIAFVKYLFHFSPNSLAVGVLAPLNPVGGYAGIVGAAPRVSFERCAKSLSKLTTVAQIEVPHCGVAWKGCQNGEWRCLKCVTVVKNRV